jgi:hypothetical protein
MLPYNSKCGVAETNGERGREKQAVIKRNGVEEWSIYQRGEANQVTSSEEDKKVEEGRERKESEGAEQIQKQTLFQNPGLSVTNRSIRRSTQTTTNIFKHRAVSYH